MTAKRHHRAESGFALVIVLWTVAILALLVAGVVGNAHREARLADTLKQVAAGRAAADGAIAAEVMAILRSGAAPARIHDVGGIRVLVTAHNLSGRMNPNIVSDRMLANLLVLLGVPPMRAVALATAIADWRSPGHVAGPHGAKAAEYKAAGLPYGPADRPFETLNQLGYVLGMTPRVLALLKPHLTLWTSSDPDPAFADGIVLEALRAIGPLPAAGQTGEAQVIELVAQAVLPGGETVRRRAVIRFGFSPDGRAWRILEWADADGT